MAAGSAAIVCAGLRLTWRFLILTLTLPKDRREAVENFFWVLGGWWWFDFDFNILTAFIRLGRARPEGAGGPPYYYYIFLFFDFDFLKKFAFLCKNYYI
jgi:hypothetical protein